MAWKKGDISAPASGPLASAAGAVGGAIGTMSSVLQVASTLLGVASALYKANQDPFAAGFNSVLQQVQNLNNDLFASGVYQLTINQFDVPGVRPVDDFGIPLLTPREALQMAINSFDDLADPNRPQFSNSATVSGFGFLATSATPDGLMALIQDILRVFGIPDWQVLLRRYQEATQLPTPASQYPDWKSLRLNSIPQLKGMQDATNKVIQNARGNLLTSDKNVTDLISMIETKASRARRLVKDMQENIAALQGAAKATGLYTLDIPSGPGGNQRLKDEIFDCPLIVSNTKYTVVAIFVGGGPSLVPINTVKGLVL